MILRKGHRLRPGGAYPKTTITIHSTANPHSTALGERQWLDNPSNARQAAWHYCVDDSDISMRFPTMRRPGTVVLPTATVIRFPLRYAKAAIGKKQLKMRHSLRRKRLWSLD